MILRILTPLLIRWAWAIRLLARRRVWPDREDIERMNDAQVRVFLRTIGLTARVEAALAEERP